MLRLQNICPVWKMVQCLAVLFFCTVAITADSSEHFQAEAGTRALHISKISNSSNIDEFLQSDRQDWSRVQDFRQRQPGYGIPSGEHTDYIFAQIVNGPAILREAELISFDSEHGNCD